ncbi:MAG TPA: hypothetical protein VKY65_00350 [Alphaproteobacteria bacterium]|nr:hypothetical protein [Alphaproteobacteria bacterium]
MIGVELLETALLLGLFVLLAGAYGILYGAGKLSQRRAILHAGFACYGIQCALALVVIAFTPLAMFWKAFIAASTLAYLGIPPVTWRFLGRMH